MASTDTLSRCRHCGAPLLRGKGRRSCPRCHPEEVAATPVDQLDLFSSKAPPRHPTPAVAVPAELPAQARPVQLPAVQLPVGRPAPLQTFGVVLGTLIVGAGLAWAGFQLWPRGPVEQSISRALAAQPRFVEHLAQDNPFFALSVEAESSPSFADLTGDGLPELILGGRSGDIRIYRNSGTVARFRYGKPTAETFGLVPTDTANTVAFADLRGNQLLDAVNAGTNGAPTFFQNRGNPLRPDFVLLPPETDPLAHRAKPAHSLDWRPTFADLDGDGDRDLFVGTRDGLSLRYENESSGRELRFAEMPEVNPAGLRGAGRLLSLAFGDLDGDGDLDAVAGNAAGEVRYFENRGSARRPKFLLLPPGALGLTVGAADATVALVDADGDGDLDCVVGGANGLLRFFENVRAARP